MKTKMNDLVFAMEVLLDQCRVIDVESVPVTGCAGRVLAEEITVTIPGTDERRIIEIGCVITPIIQGALIAHNMDLVNVYRKIMVGVYDMHAFDDQNAENDVHSKVNRYVSGTALKENGFSVNYQGCLVEEERLASALKMAAATFDAIVIFGDNQGNALDELIHEISTSGAQMLVEQIDMEPGSQTCVASLDNVPIFGVSGSVEDRLTAIRLVIVPILRQISGRANADNSNITVELTEDFQEENEIARVLFGQLDLADGMVRFRRRQTRTADDFLALREVNTAVIVPAGRGPLKKGTLVNAYQI